MADLLFYAYGVPKPGGSKRGFILKGKGGTRDRVVITEDCKTSKSWRSTVADSAIEARAKAGMTAPFQGPVMLSITFRMPRPKSHYRTGKHAGELKPEAPTFHTQKPDRTKLTRSTEDALTGILWRDDAQVVCGEVVKEWANDGPCALIVVQEVDEKQRRHV